jgi:hypothetical protein
MNACDIIPFQWPRKEKVRKASKTCIFEYLEPYFSAKSPPYPTYIAKMLFQL